MSSMKAERCRFPALLRLSSRVYISSSQRRLCRPVSESTLAFSSMQRIWYSSSHTTLLLLRRRRLRSCKKFRHRSCEALSMASAVSPSIIRILQFSLAKTLALGLMLSKMDISPAQCPGWIWSMYIPPWDSTCTSRRPSRRTRRRRLGLSGSIRSVPGSGKIVLQPSR